jgi:hypothetical protein
MHFHLGGRDLLEDLTTWAIIQEMVSIEVLASRERERGSSSQENWTIQNAKLDHLVSPKSA